MQGNLSEIDIRSILQLIELGQRTGQLYVEAYSSLYGNTVAETRHNSDPHLAWLVFFVNGQIVYGSQNSNSLSRLGDYLRRYKAENTFNNIKLPSLASVNAPEYGYLWVLLENRVLTPAQGRGIINNMIQEILFDLLSLHRGSFIFELGPPLTPQLTTLEISSLLAKIIKQVQEWNQFSPHIQSPDQCPLISNTDALQKALPSNTFNVLQHWADGKTSIRQMARYLNRDVLTVAKAIYPFVQQGLVQILGPTNETVANKRKSRQMNIAQPKILCIDDDVVVREKVTMILTDKGYEVAAVGDPLQALGEVFRWQPDLILCDIAMPSLDGYEVCSMLRNSTRFRQTPIIMLTGIDGFIDRLKARIIGATDYLTKPFGESELLMLIEKNVGPGYNNPSLLTPLS
jgi:twitching motility two-component system response regulator PilG